MERPYEVIMYYYFISQHGRKVCRVRHRFIVFCQTRQCSSANHKRLQLLSGQKCNSIYIAVAVFTYLLPVSMNKCY